MGADEYHPIGHRGSNISSSGGIGYTIADAIDTMYIMGLDAEYSRARQWIQEELTFDREGIFSTFEVRRVCLERFPSSLTFEVLDYYPSSWWAIVNSSPHRGQVVLKSCR